MLRIVYSNKKGVSDFFSAILLCMLLAPERFLFSMSQVKVLKVLMPWKNFWYYCRHQSNCFFFEPLVTFIIKWIASKISASLDHLPFQAVSSLLVSKLLVTLFFLAHSWLLDSSCQAQAQIWTKASISNFRIKSTMTIHLTLDITCFVFLSLHLSLPSHLRYLFHPVSRLNTKFWELIENRKAY